MKHVRIPVLWIGLALLLSASAVWAYTIDDSISAGENIKFNWTKNGAVFQGAWSYLYKCEGDANWTQGNNPPGGFVLDWNNIRPDLAGKACDFKFTAPAGATDWRQEIIGQDGSSDVYGGNVRRNSPWRFHDLNTLPQVYTRIPDIAPVAGDPEMTIYTAVNLDLYMTENPQGFLGGEWAPGDSLNDLGVKIVDGQVVGVEGIYWATTPFEFDPDPAGPGFVPSGGSGTLLSSTDLFYDLVIVQQHVDLASSADVNKVDAAPTQTPDN